MISEGIQPVKGVPTSISSAYRDQDGTLWFGARNALGRLSNNSFVPVPLPDGLSALNEVQAITRTPTGDLWISVTHSGTFRLSKGVWKKRGGLDGIPRSIPLVEFTDSAGRVWFGYSEGFVSMLQGDRVRTFSSKDGLSVGSVTAISEYLGDVWVGGASGLQYFDGHSFQALTAGTGVLKSISGIVQRTNGDLWLNQFSGVVRIEKDEIEIFKHDSSHKARCVFFDTLDGLPGAPISSRRLPSAVQGTDGRLWFTAASGLAWIAPDHIATNPIRPSVVIKSMKADGRIYRNFVNLMLPKRIQNLQIDYTALSLSMPERVRFRYNSVRTG